MTLHGHTHGDIYKFQNVCVYINININYLIDN